MNLIKLTTLPLDYVCTLWGEVILQIGSVDVKALILPVTILQFMCQIGRVVNVKGLNVGNANIVPVQCLVK